MKAEDLVYALVDQFDDGADPKDLVYRLQDWASAKCASCGEPRREHKKRHRFVEPGEVTIVWDSRQRT